jgi:raffinose/stachyose/melibiose transport system permease protein
MVLKAVGLGSYARSWLGEKSISLWAIIFTGFPWVGAFQFLIYIGGLINIPGELYEAAKMDGVSVWQRFWRIDVPMLRSQLALILFFAFIGSVQGYQNILLLTNGGPGYSTYVPAFQMYQKLAAEGQYGYASAIGVMLFLVVLVGTIVNQTLLRKKG